MLDKIRKSPAWSMSIKHHWSDAESTERKEAGSKQQQVKKTGKKKKIHVANIKTEAEVGTKVLN